MVPPVLAMKKQNGGQNEYRTIRLKYIQRDLYAHEMRP